MAESKLKPRRWRTRETVALEMPSSPAMCSWVRRWRRKASTASAVAREIWRGDESGFEDRFAQTNDALPFEAIEPLDDSLGRGVEVSCGCGVGEPALQHGRHHV